MSAKNPQPGERIRLKVAVDFYLPGKIGRIYQVITKEDGTKIYVTRFKNVITSEFNTTNLRRDDFVVPRNIPVPAYPSPGHLWTTPPKVKRRAAYAYDDKEII